jgi:hypothetical protein
MTPVPVTFLRPQNRGARLLGTDRALGSGEDRRGILSPVVGWWWTPTCGSSAAEGPRHSDRTLPVADRDHDCPPPLQTLSGRGSLHSALIAASWCRSLDQERLAATDAGRQRLNAVHRSAGLMRSSTRASAPSLTAVSATPWFADRGVPKLAVLRQLSCHTGEGRCPSELWIPAFAGRQRISHFL